MVGFTIVLGRRKKQKHLPKRHKAKKREVKKVYFLPIIFLAVFAVVASFFVDKKEEDFITSEIATQHINAFREINDYSEYYIPVVMNDFTSYKNGENIDNEMLIKLGIWSILSASDKSHYEAFDGELHIPAKDVEERISQLFSGGMKTENKSIEDEKYSILFDEQTECYIIPTMGFSPEYTPLLESVAAKGSTTILSVGCLRSDNYKQDSSGNTVVPEAERIIIITLKKEKNSFYIESISEE